MPFFGSRFFAKGFVLSTDILLAVILVISFTGIATLIGFENASITETQVLYSQSRDALVQLDETGVVFNALDINGASDANKMQAIANQLTAILPQKTLFRVELDEYSYNSQACQAGQSFSTCFTLSKTYPAAGSALPSDKSVSRQEMVLNRKGTATSCRIQGGYISLSQEEPAPLPPANFLDSPALFSSEKNGTQNAKKIIGTPAISKKFFSSKKENPVSNANFSGGTAFFSAANDANILLSVSINPSQNITCDQDIRVDLNVTVLSFGRPPVDVAMVMDRSGSMSWDGRVGVTDARDVVVDNTIAYLADGSGGMRTISVSNPKLPALMDVYNTPGTAYDNAQDSNKYVYVADGASGFRIINAIDPSNTTSVSTLANFQPALGVDVNNNFVYLATTGNGAIYDVSTTGSAPNTNLGVGQNTTTDTNAGQSFVTTNGVISGVELRLRKVANPAANLTVRLRSTYDGADLGSIQVTAASLTTSYATYQLDFATPIPVTAGGTYYIVLTTTTVSGTNYYQVGARSSNPYSSGAAYKNNVAQTSDFVLRTNVYGGLQTINAVTKASPYLAGTYRTSDATDVTVSGSYLYLADGTNGLKIFSLAIPQQPVYVGGIDTTDASRVAISGSTAFVADAASGLRIIDISSPAFPTLTTTYNTPSNAYDVFVQNNIAYVADNTSLQVIDVSNPASPLFVKSFDTTYNYRGLFVQGNTAYIASQSQGLITIDLDTGPRIDQSKAAGSFMLDYNFWKPADQLALVSFSSGGGSPTLDQNLTNSHTDINNALYALIASGGTNIESGIRGAIPELVNILPTSMTNNSTLRFGYSSSESTAGQGFLQVGNRSITGVKVLLQKFASPGDITVALRTSIGGSNVTTATISSFAVATGSYSWYTATFATPVALTDQSEYFIVLSKSGSSSTTNYYRWGINTTDPYWAETAYQQSSSQSGSDMTLQITYLPVTQNASAQKFQIVMSDGQSNVGDSLSAAQDANALGITIFTVAFGADADVDELQAVADASDGVAYVATDLNSLAAFYVIIAEKIGEIAAQGNTQIIIDGNVLVPIPSGVTVTDFDGGAPLTIGSQNYVYYFVNDLNGSNKSWGGYFIMHFDCNNSATCSDQNRIFPPDGTVLEWKDINGLPQATLPWDNNISVPIKYRDLTVSVIGADPLGNQASLFDLNGINSGYLSTGPTQIEILKDSPKTGTVLASVPVSSFACGEKEIGCFPYFELSFDTTAIGEGNLFAVINRDGAILECPNNNAVQINCESQQSRYLIMRLWMWNQ